MLIKLGGAAVDEAVAHPALFTALAGLHRDLAGGLVLVHGGGAAVDRRLDRLGLASEKRQGIRITPPDQIDEVVATLAGLVNKRLVGLLRRAGVRAVGLCLGDGGTARCTTARQYDFDPGRVGEVAGIDAQLLDTLLDAGFLPVVCSIGLDDDGAALNINADDAAAALAAHLRTAGLVLLTDEPGVRGGDGVVLDELNEEQVERLIGSGGIFGGMIPKVRSALHVAAAAGAPVTIASWSDPAVIRRLARGEPVGTRIIAGSAAAASPPIRDRLATTFRSHA
jgi:acetylglutamate kinase